MATGLIPEKEFELQTQNDQKYLIMLASLIQVYYKHLLPSLQIIH